jgi:hypothetical protein
VSRKSSKTTRRLKAYILSKIQASQTINDPKKIATGVDRLTAAPAAVTAEMAGAKGVAPGAGGGAGIGIGTDTIGIGTEIGTVTGKETGPGTTGAAGPGIAGGSTTTATGDSEAASWTCIA